MRLEENIRLLILYRFRSKKANMRNEKRNKHYNKLGY